MAATSLLFALVPVRGGFRERKQICTKCSFPHAAAQNPPVPTRLSSCHEEAAAFFFRHLKAVTLETTPLSPFRSFAAQADSSRSVFGNVMSLTGVRTGVGSTRCQSSDSGAR